MILIQSEHLDCSLCADEMFTNSESVRYITHNSCAISVVPPFNRLWARVSAVVLA